MDTATMSILSLLQSESLGYNGVCRACCTYADGLELASASRREDGPVRSFSYRWLVSFSGEF